MTGCTTFQIVDLKPQVLVSGNLEHSVNSIAGIETIRVIDSEYRDAGEWEQGLADVLRDKGVFKSVSYPYIDKGNIDIIISGEMEGEFRHHGAKNFFTWWPGPLLLAHSWRGTRYIYDAHADIKAIDANTGELLGEYHAESSYELIHRSYNPGHVLGALLIIPGVVKGGINVSPREKYRQQIYEVVYPNLWEKIAINMDEDLSKKQSQRIVSLKDKCGRHFDETPEIGMVWSEFISCQTRKYGFSGQETIEGSVVSVYTSNDRYFRIYVAKGGHITRWFVKK